MLIIPRLTVAEVATVINAALTFMQYTLDFAIVAIFIYFINPINSAHTWSIISRSIHSSLWPTVLRIGSAGNPNDFRLSSIGVLSSFTAVLIPLASVVTPLGLKNGPLIQTAPQIKNASYISDSSPIGNSTSTRNDYIYSRICGFSKLLPCPGNSDIGNISIAPSILETFSSMSQGAFNIQFRNIYTSERQNNLILDSFLSISQSFALRNDIFPVEGLVADFTGNYGVGFWNHTLPLGLELGGTWSQEMLWVEPVTYCVNTNLTIDYNLGEFPGITYLQSTSYNLTDRGGFTYLATEYPQSAHDGQNINLYASAFNIATQSNALAMNYFNTTPESSFVGKSYPVTTPFISTGSMEPLFPDYTNLTNASGIIDANLQFNCDGYGGADNANIASVGIHCGIFLGTPVRTDGRDARNPSVNSTWSQALHGCASVTRASIQNVRFSFNGTNDLTALTFSRELKPNPVLWGLENANLNITDVTLFWGRVSDTALASDANISTTQSQYLYLPAGMTDIYGLLAPGQPTSVFSASWYQIYTPVTSAYNFYSVYSGTSNVALRSKYQNTLESDPNNSPAQILNLIWTDIVANNVVGSDTNKSLLVTSYTRSVSFNPVYGIPIMALFIIWVPTFLTTAGMLLMGILKISYIRVMLEQTSFGRALVGANFLKIENEEMHVNAASVKAIPVSTDEPETLSNNVIPRFEDKPLLVDSIPASNKPANDKYWSKHEGRTRFMLQHLRPGY